MALHREIRTPLRVQLEHGLRNAIQTGRVSSGSRLPSSRVLSSELGVSRGLVIEAYEQLIAEGYLCSHPGSSTYVSERPTYIPPPVSKPEVFSSPRYDFRPGRPDHSPVPALGLALSITSGSRDRPSVSFRLPRSSRVAASACCTHRIPQLLTGNRGKRRPDGFVHRIRARDAPGL